MGLSSGVDVVQDDALLSIWDAIRKQGCPVRHSPHMNTNRHHSSSNGTADSAADSAYCKER